MVIIRQTQLRQETTESDQISGKLPINFHQTQRTNTFQLLHIDDDIPPRDHSVYRILLLHLFPPISPRIQVNSTTSTIWIAQCVIPTHVIRFIQVQKMMTALFAMIVLHRSLRKSMPYTLRQEHSTMSSFVQPISKIFILSTNDYPIASNQ